MCSCRADAASLEVSEHMNMSSNSFEAQSTKLSHCVNLWGKDGGNGEQISEKTSSPYREMLANLLWRPGARVMTWERPR